MRNVFLAALLAAVTLPIAVSAQVPQPPPQTQAQGQSSTEYRRWTRRLTGINLSSQQQQQVQNLLNQFAASHPPGTPRDRAGAHALREQIFAVLNPQQQAQLQQQIRAMRAQHRGQAPMAQPVQPAPPLR